MKQHPFTNNITKILEKKFGKNADFIFKNSLLIQYINLKTQSANKGSKSRSSFANLYAIYVIVEDYIANNFHHNGNYANYEGAVFTKLFTRQRELPFGSKLQNHALNNRMNAEFQKFFPTYEYIPILRNLETNRYWINEHLLKVEGKHKVFNIAEAIIEIINEYIETKKDSFQKFIHLLEEFSNVQVSDINKVVEFIKSLLLPNTDARLFEIVSYAILKYHYQNQHIYWGYNEDDLTKENLQLFKTGRTNANDGGIDFVMRPLGRFFQVTETLDFKKYFLDIDKIQKYPITFVVKSEDSEAKILEKIKENALKTYSITHIVEKYMNCIEKIINIPLLNQYFSDSIKENMLNKIMEEIILQSRIEFNYSEE